MLRKLEWLEGINWPVGDLMYERLEDGYVTSGYHKRHEMDSRGCTSHVAAHCEGERTIGGNKELVELQRVRFKQ